MNEIEWPLNQQTKDSVIPPEKVEGETFYTLQRIDFLRMPDVDFVEIAAEDPFIRALFN